MRFDYGCQQLKAFTCSWVPKLHNAIFVIEDCNGDKKWAKVVDHRFNFEDTVTIAVGSKLFAVKKRSLQTQKFLNLSNPARLKIQTLDLPNELPPKLDGFSLAAIENDFVIMTGGI